MINLIFDVKDKDRVLITLQAMTHCIDWIVPLKYIIFSPKLNSAFFFY